MSQPSGTTAVSVGRGASADAFRLLPPRKRRVDGTSNRNRSLKAGESMSCPSISTRHKEVTR
jgi:hypothetical protein